VLPLYGLWARCTAIWRHTLSVDKSKGETVSPEQGGLVLVPEKEKKKDPCTTD
jgi:hypothetical protein